MDSKGLDEVGQTEYMSFDFSDTGYKEVAVSLTGQLTVSAQAGYFWYL